MGTDACVDTKQLVEVAAPATLSEGYSFQAVHNGVNFSVTVPAGGVEKGQEFLVPFQPYVSEATPLTGGGTSGTSSGHWKDGLFDCCKFGICHTSFLNAMCFPQILMAQVLTRLKLDMFANPTPSNEWRMTFKRILILVVCYFIFYGIFSPPSPGIEVDDEGNFIVIPVDCPSWQRALYTTGSTLFGIYTLIVLMKTRAAVRARYSIPEQRCHGMEDCCCAFWCGCCTVAQVARQTADYDQQRAVCCSDTGLPHSMEPAIIV